MNVKKFLVRCYAGLVRNREKRRAVRDVLLASTDDPFVFIEGMYAMNDTDWVTYLLTHNMPDMVSALRQGLDKKSNELLDLIFCRMVILPKCGNSRRYKVHKEWLCTLLTPEELADQHVFSSELPQYRKDFFLDEPIYLPETFTFHHGLRNKSDKLKKYIAGKDFIDAGAHIGDSALMFLRHYAPRCVHSFEISKKTCKRYENVMRMNNISADQYQLCAMGLSDRKGEITFHDSAGVGTSVLRGGTSKVQLTDLDSFTRETNLKVGFIKADVEGVCLQATQGMKETIRKDRPVLALAIYHSPEEFFEVKPALDEITMGLDYKITIEKHLPILERTVEIVIFAYPKELDNE